MAAEVVRQSVRFRVIHFNEAGKMENVTAVWNDQRGTRTCMCPDLLSGCDHMGEGRWLREKTEIGRLISQHVSWQVEKTAV